MTAPICRVGGCGLFAVAFGDGTRCLNCYRDSLDIVTELHHRRATRSRHAERLDALVRKLDRLGEDELDLVDSVVDGLVDGRHLYGEFNATTDQRDLAAEAFAEARDLVTYTAMQLLKLRRRNA